MFIENKSNIIKLIMNTCALEEDLLFLTNISYCLGSNFLPHCLNQDTRKSLSDAVCSALKLFPSRRLPKALSAELEDNHLEYSEEMNI